jgi:hypothetical protein
MLASIRALKERYEIGRDVRDLFDSDRGKRVLVHIMKVAGITRPTFVTDPSTLLLNEGTRRLAYSILHQALGSEDLAAKFIIENMELEEKQNDSTTRSAL